MSSKPASLVSEGGPSFALVSIGDICTICSPRIPRRTRDVVITLSSGQPLRRLATSSAAASETRSQLSIMRRRFGVFPHWMSTSSADEPDGTNNPSWEAHWVVTDSGSRNVVRSTNQMPPSMWVASAWAASIAIRVLPMPPAPRRETHRDRPTDSTMSARRSCRPMNEVVGVGTLVMRCRVSLRRGS